MRNLKILFTIYALFCISMPFCFAQDDYEDYGPKPRHAEDVLRQDAENEKKYRDDEDVLVLSGLVARRRDKKVEVAVESTGVASSDAAEFLVVHASSFHGYESILWSHAMPSDIHRALEFIGLKAGGPRNPSQLRFWGKGARVVIYLSNNEDKQAIPLETMLYDREKGEALPQRGFIFTGSMRVTDPENPATTVYAADHYAPNSIVSAFNDPTAVLDVGWQVSKQEAYQSYVPNPETVMPGNQLYTLIIEPAAKDDQPSTKDLILTVKDPQTFILADSDSGERLTPESTIDAALEECRKLVQKSIAPYVTLHFSNDMTLREIKPIRRGMAILDQPAALRIEPPQSGRLYYKSFIPNPNWQDAANRMTQSWEIHIERQNGELKGEMVFHEPVWKEGSIDPDYKTLTYPVSSGQDVREKLDADAAERKQKGKRQPPPVLMVYAPANLTYGTLLEFLSPALKTHKTVHLFLEQDTQ